MRKPNLKRLRTLGRNRAFGVIALGLLVGAGLIIWWSMAQPDSSKAAWFDDGYAYRQTVAITNSGSAVTDFQIGITLDTATLITAGKMQSNCADIRIVDQNSKVLPMWIETGNNACNTATTKIWTKMSSISTTGNPLYLYYGNPTATSIENGNQVFIFFDDFANTTVNAGKWTSTVGGSIGQSGGNLEMVGSNAWNATVLTAKASTDRSSGVVFSWNVKFSATTAGTFSGYGPSTPNFSSGLYLHTSTPNWVRYLDGSFSIFGSTYTNNTWYRLDMKVKPTGYTLLLNGTQLEDVAGSWTTNNLYLQMMTYYSGQTVYYDFVYSRKYAATEPTVGSPANEEKSPAPVAYWKFDEGTGNLARNVNGGADITTGLVGYWNNNETSWNGTSGEVKDQTQFANNGTAVGGVSTTSSGKYSYAGSFAGTDDVVTTPDSSSLTLGGPFTISVWVYPTSLPTSGNLQSIVSKYDGGANSGGYDLRLYNDSGTQKIGLTTLTAGGTPGGSDIAYTLPTNTWSLLTAMYDGTNSIIYVNGVLAGTAANTAAPGDNTKLLNIGNFGYYTVTATTLSRYFVGRIDEVRLYNKLINSTQMNTLYNLGPEGTLAGSTKPTWQTEDQCISGKCLYFNGTTSYVLAAPYSAINTTEGTGLTVGAWVKMTQTGSTQAILTKQQNTTNEFFYTLNINSSNQAEFSVGKQNVSGNTATGATALVVDQWYYLVGTYDGTNIKIFVNSTQDGSTTEAFSSSTQSLSAVNIGQAYNGTQFFKGFIDEPKIYNYVRTDTQLKTDFNARGGTEGSSSNLGNNITNMPAALSNGLVGYWKMDESSWTNNCSTATVLDSSGNGNNGLACPNTTGPTGGAVGKYGNGGSFDATNDYVSFGSSKFDSISNGTVGAWIYFSGSGSNDNVIYSHYVDSNNRATFFVSDTGNTVSFENCVGGSCSAKVTSTTALTVNTWYHLAATFGGEGMKLYVNGTLESTHSSTSGFASYGSSTGNFLGWFTGYGAYYNGKMDEVRMYNRALSADEIRQLANWAPGPDGYWGLNEGSGISAFDQSGYGINGTLTGSPSYDTGKYGKALSLNGTSSWINLGSTSLARKVNAITLMAWVNIRTAASGSNQSILNISINNSGTPTNSSRAVMDIYSDGTITSGGRSTDAETIQNVFSTADAPVNEWVHLASVIDYENDTITIYQNGIKQATTGTVSFSSTQTADSVSASGSIGSDDSGTQQYFPGKIDEAKVYKYARTQKQIIEDMNAGHPAPGSPVSTSIGWWKFNEGADNTCSGGTNDACNSGSSGSTLDGAGSGFASPATSTSGWTSAGKFGKALSFDGTNDYISVGSEDTFDLTGDMAMSLWFKSSSSTSQMMVAGKHDCGSNNGYFFRQNAQATGDIQFQHSRDNNTPITISGSYNDGNWHHLVGVISGSTSYIYVDGKPRGSQALSVSYTSNSIPFQVGTVDSNACGFGTSSYNGQIDEVKFYTGALTASQVALEYNQSSAQVQGAISDNSTYQLQAQNQEYCVPGDSTSCAAPIAEWKMETGTGTSALDTSGNAKTLTLTNSPTWYLGKTGKGVNFNHSLTNNDYLTRADDSDFDFGAGSSFTIGGWFTLPSLPLGSTSMLLSKYNEAGYKIGYSDTTGELYCGLDYDSTWTPTDISTIPFVPNGGWHHVSCVKNANSSLTIYLDGRPGTVDSSLTNSTLANSDPLYIGVDADGTTNDWSGTVDEFRIYNYARTQAQMMWEYNKGLPVGWWKMDECQGTTINDSAGNSLTGTLTNATPGTCTTSASTAWYNGRTGKINSSISFDGIDDYVAVNNSRLNNFADFGTNTGFSISAWVKTSAASNQTIVGLGSSGSSTPMLAMTMLSTGTVRFQYRSDNGTELGSGTWDTTRIINDGNWHHLLIRRNGSTFAIFIDGQQAYSGVDASGFNTVTTDRQTIGALRRNTDIQYFTGQIDDARLYNYSLYDSQIKTLYNIGGAVRYAPVTGAP